MRRLLLPTVLAVFVPMLALAAEQLILGNKLLLRDPGTTEKRKVLVKAREKASPNTIVGDPVVNGATLTITANGATATSQLFLLPGGDSPTTGRPFWSGDALRGFNYKDARGENGPVKKVKIKAAGGTFQVGATLAGKLGLITVLPPDPGTDACVVLELTGGDAYSLFFGGDARIDNKGATLFKVSKPAAEGSCIPPPPDTTTTTTTLEEPTTTTETTSTTTTTGDTSTTTTTMIVETTTTTVEEPTTTTSTEVTTTTVEETTTTTLP